MLKGSSNATVTNESKIIFTRNIADTDESDYIASIYTGNYTGPLILDSGRGGHVKVIGNHHGTNPLFIVNHNAPGSGVPAELFRVCGNGRVGIGTTSPGEKLEIKQGNIKITQHNSGFGDEIYGLILKNGVHNRTLYVAGKHMVEAELTRDIYI